MISRTKISFTALQTRCTVLKTRSYVKGLYERLSLILSGILLQVKFHKMHSYKMWKSRTSQCARTTQQRLMGVQIIEGCQSIFIKCWSLFAWHINHENAPTTFLSILQAERFLWNSNTFRKCSACEPYRKTSGRNCTIFASKNEAVCRELHMHFWRSLPPGFKENVLGAIPRFFNPTTKLLAVEFRRIFKVLCKRVLQNKFWGQFHDFCVRKRSC